MGSIRIGLVGDTHGDTKDAVNVINEMGKRKITHVFIVGDVGIWTHHADGVEFLDEVNAAAKENNCTIFAIGGNHENWDHWNWFVENMPTHKGFAMVRRRVLLAPKAHEFRLAGKQFVVAGGAVSIDRDWRRERERGMYDRLSNRTVRGTGARTLWWPNEELTDEDVSLIESRFPKADILLTHDCSNYTPFEGRLKPDEASEIHRKRIDRVLRAVTPKVHFHGHMHTKYDWTNTLGSGMFGSEPEFSIRTYGLECNPEAMWARTDGDWWGILETDDLSFAYKGRGMNFRSLE